MVDSIDHMPERPLPPRWLRTDSLVALALAAVGSAMVLLAAAAGVPFYETHPGLQVLGTFLVAAPLAVRRRFPMAAATVQAAVYIVVPYTLGMDLYTSQVMLFLGFYSIGAWSARRGRALIVRTTIAVVMAVWLVASMFGGLNIPGYTPPSMSATQLLAYFAISGSINVAYFAGAWVFGDRAWQQWLERNALERAHADIAVLQQELVESAVEGERVRIARELHDVVAHHVTAMSVQAAAARRLLGRDAARAEESLRQVEASARSAVQDLRTMVLTLRASDTDSDSLPTLADLDELVAAAERNGQSVTYERIGDLPELSPAAELTLYRVAQEGLTNASKHAGPTAHVALRLRAAEGAVELEVSDDGRATASLVPGTGTGLQGMRERVTAVGGRLEAGPKPRGGFMVRASIPVAEAA